MRCYRIRPTASGGVRDTIGGRPLLALGQSWPTCRCGARMVFFFQCDVPGDLAPFGGSHLLVFQCPVHNDTWLPSPTYQVRPGFWKDASWSVLLNPFGPTVAAEPPDPYLVPAGLTVTEFADAAPDHRGMQMWKLGGTPSWAQDPERYRCACGSELLFLGQVPEGQGFVRQARAPEQPLSPEPDQYVLFVGHEVYLFACAARCDPRAVWPVNQC